MVFYKQGKKLNYGEIIETINSLNKHNILPQLEVQELNNLVERILTATTEVLQARLLNAGYKANTTRDIFDKAARLNLITDLKTWNQAIKLVECEDSVLDDTAKEALIQFMQNDYLEAMKNLSKKLGISARC